jgi:hypothetical protein
VILNNCGTPEHETEFPKKIGVTLICPEMALTELLIPVKEFIVPVPAEFKPIDELLLVQL